MADRIIQFFKIFFPTSKQEGTQEIQIDVHDQFSSHPLNRKVRFDIYKPSVYDDKKYRSFPLLILNDGQDMEGIGLKQTLENLYAHQLIQPVIIVAIHAGYRMQEYGTSHTSDYKQRGSLAKQYEKFVIDELLPFLKRDYRPLSEKIIAGFSLGGLSAFDIGWRNPQVFSKIGIFSGSFWWRSTPFNQHRPDEGRIIIDLIQDTPQVPNVKFWLQTGTLDESSDRNNNGVIDAIDDTIDVIQALSKRGYRQGKDIDYLELIGGHHNLETWGKAMPDFLIWAFGNKIKQKNYPPDVLIQTRRVKV